MAVAAVVAVPGIRVPEVAWAATAWMAAAVAAEAGVAVTAAAARAAKASPSVVLDTPKNSSGSCVRSLVVCGRAVADG